MRRSSRAVIVFLSFVACLALSQRARAQDTTFSLDRLRIGGAPNDGISVWRPEIQDNVQLFGQFALGFSYNPFRIEHEIQDDAQARQMAAVSGAPVRLQLTGYADIGIEVYQRFAFQVMFPMTFAQTGNPTTAAGIPSAKDAVNLDTAAPGDLRFEARGVLVRTSDDFFKLGVNAEVEAPSGNDKSFTGEKSAAGGVGTASELDFKDFVLTLDAGVHFRPESGVNDFLVNHEVTYGLGGFLPLRDGRVRLGLEVFGSVQIAGDQAAKLETTPLEWMAEGRFTLDDKKRLYLNGFGGTRLTPGYAPDFRTGIAIGYSFPILEPTPPSPERTPKFDNLNSNVDTDKDGYPDNMDLCPTEPEDGKPPFTTDGCPGTDRDGDGIPDSLDKCPDTPEDKDGVDDNDGCPEDDADKDDVPDAEDACPKEPGVKSPVKEKNGCPQFIRRISGSNEIQVLKKVEFEFGSARLSPSSFPILDEVQRLLVANPDITLMSIEGHTDNKGGDELNLKLSKDRAKSCLDYLVQKGIAPGRLTSEGFGKNKPLESNDTAEGRSKNRRVEFHIKNQAIGPGAPTGSTPNTPTPGE
ncbi:MAG TPA: OmpA family protein [Polyangiaceae bacterium]|jgi:outer membrane protein OmpA-like peptidoglycan-associated protein|nr:OmpA family protein [Polyangiaceae bacterium]